MGLFANVVKIKLDSFVHFWKKAYICFGFNQITSRFNSFLRYIHSQAVNYHNFMELIRELVHLIHRRAPEKVQDALYDGSKTYHFYNLVVKNKIRTDEEAAWAIYQSSPAEKKYSMLKKYLRDRLTEFVTDMVLPENHASFEELRNNCRQEVNIGYKLIEVGAFLNAEKILNRLRQKAALYHLHEYWAASAHALSRLYLMMGLYLDSAKMREEAVAAETIWRKEDELSWEWFQLRIRLNDTLAPDEEEIAQLHACIEKMRALYEEAQQPHMLLQLHYANWLSHWYIQNYEAAAETLQNWRKVHEDHEHLQGKGDYWLIDYCTAMLLRQDEKWKPALQKVIDSLRHCPESEPFRLQVEVLHFDLRIKLRQFKKAGVILRYIHRQSRWDMMSNLQKGSWYLRAVQLYIYLARNGHTAVLPKFGDIHTLPVEEVAALIQPLSRDKRGFHALSICTRMLLLGLKSPELLGEEVNNLKVYYQRHLRDISVTRTSLFFKHMIQCCRLSGRSSVKVREAYLKEAKAYSLLTLDEGEHFTYPDMITFFA